MCIKHLKRGVRLSRARDIEMDKVTATELTCGNATLLILLLQHLFRFASFRVSPGKDFPPLLLLSLEPMSNFFQQDLS